MILGIAGLPGAGKTLTMTYMAYRSWISGRKLLSNYNLYFPKRKGLKHPLLLNGPADIDNFLKTGDTSPKLLLFDEIWTNLDRFKQRTSKREYMDDLALTARKLNCHVIYTSQTLRQVGSTVLRAITQNVIIPELDWGINYCRANYYYPYEPATPTGAFFQYKPWVIMDLYHHREVVREF